MAVVDEASVRITPDVSGFAEELRTEVEAAIEEATAGLDKTIHIKLDVDTNDAAAKMRQAMDDFGNAGHSDLDKLKADEQNLFNDIGANAEKSRVKQSDEQTKLRDKTRQIWEPAVQRLKAEQIDEKLRLDQITVSAEKAAKAIASQAGNVGTEAAIKAEEALTAARKAGEAEATKERATEATLEEARKAATAASKEAKQAEEEASKARIEAQQATQEARNAEEALGFARRGGKADADQLRTLEGEVALAREEARAKTEAAAAAERVLDEARARQFDAVGRIVEGERALGVSRNASERASGEARRGEEDLRNSRVAGVTGTRAFVAAEKELFSGRKEGVNGTRAFASAEEALRATETAHVGVLGRLEGATKRVGTAVRNQGNEMSKAGKKVKEFGDGTSLLSTVAKVAGGVVQGFGQIVSGVGTLMDGAKGATDLFTGGLGNLKDAVGAAISGLVNFGQQLALIGVIGGAVSYAVGAIGAAMAGLPALVGAAAVSFAVFKLGMDGIKKAYDVGLKPALEALKKQVSDVFEKTLTPAFREMATTLIPQITTSMKGLAQAFADTGSMIIHMVDSAANITKINDIINNTATAVRDQLNPALLRVVQIFIDIGSQAPVMQAMVGIIADLINNVTNWLDEMNRLNLIVPAVQALRTALDAAEKAITNLLTGAVQFFTAATPGFAALATSIGNVARDVLPALGQAFGTAMQAASDLINAIPPSVWQGITDAVKQLADKLLEMANDPAVQQWAIMIVEGIGKIIQAITLALTAFQKIVDAIGKVAEAAQKLGSALGLLPPPAKLTADQFDQAAQKAGLVKDQFGNLVPAAQAAGQGMAGAGQSATGATPPITGMGDAAKDAADKAKAAGQGAGNAFDPIAANAAKTGAAIPPAINPPVNAIPGTVQTATGQVSFQPVLDEANRVFGALPQSVATGINASVQSMTDGTNQMKQVAADAATAIQTSFTNMGTNVGNTMANLATAVAGAATGIKTQFAALATAVTTSMTTISTAVTTSMTAVTTTITTNLTAVQTKFTTTFTAIQTADTTFWTQMKQMAQQSLQQIQQNIQQVLQQIMQLVQQTYQQLIQLTQQTWQQLLQIVTTMGQQIVQQCRTIAQQILQVFTELAGQLEAAGNTMMQRLAAGITAGGAAAVAAAANVAAQIKAQFPASPAKEGPLSGQGDPLRTGGVIMTRLASGMTAQLGAVVTSARATAAAINRAFGTTGTGDSGLAAAARELLNVLRSGGSVFEDFTYKGNDSANLLKYHDQLSEMFWGKGGGDMQTFLKSLTTGVTSALDSYARIFNPTFTAIKAMAWSLPWAVAQAVQTTGISVTRSSSADVVAPSRRIANISPDQVAPASAPRWNASNGGILAEDGTYVNPNFYNNAGGGVTPQAIAQALHGCELHISDDGRGGIAKIVNRQNRALARR